MVQARGRKCPVQSANPETEPFRSYAGRSLTAAATPDVPRDTDTSPTAIPKPRAAIALSPPPGAMMQPPSTAPPAIDGEAFTLAASCGPSTAGSTMRAAACRHSGAGSSAAADCKPRASRSRR